jgi:hypothetical protein
MDERQAQREAEETIQKHDECICLCWGAEVEICHKCYRRFWRTLRRIAGLEE